MYPDSMKASPHVVVDNGIKILITFCRTLHVGPCHLGSSYHVCHNGDLYDAYWSIKVSNIIIADRQTCNNVGIGRVISEIDDDNGLTLSYARHVIEIRKILISLDCLESWAHIRGKGGV